MMSHSNSKRGGDEGARGGKGGGRLSPPSSSSSVFPPSSSSSSHCPGMKNHCLDRMGIQGNQSIPASSSHALHVFAHASSCPASSSPYASQQQALPQGSGAVGGGGSSGKNDDELGFLGCDEGCSMGDYYLHEGGPYHGQHDHADADDPEGDEYEQDEAEREHFASVRQAFELYEQDALLEVARIERHLRRLGPEDLVLLKEPIDERIDQLKEAIAVNQAFINFMLVASENSNMQPGGGVGGEGERHPSPPSPPPPPRRSSPSSPSSGFQDDEVDSDHEGNHGDRAGGGGGGEDKEERERGGEQDTTCSHRSPSMKEDRRSPPGFQGETSSESSLLHTQGQQAVVREHHHTSQGDARQKEKDCRDLNDIDMATRTGGLTTYEGLDGGDAAPRGSSVKKRKKKKKRQPTSKTPTQDNKPLPNTTTTTTHTSSSSPISASSLSGRGRDIKGGDLTAHSSSRGSTRPSTAANGDEDKLRLPLHTNHAGSQASQQHTIVGDGIGRKGEGEGSIIMLSPAAGEGGGGGYPGFPPDIDHEKLMRNMSKVRSTLRQFVRDWSEEGEEERQAAYGPLLQALEAKLPIKDPAHPPRVLCPGSGLGRLPFEVSRRGYACQGNEFSYFMLIGSDFILNHAIQTKSCPIQPYCLSTSNRRNRFDHLQTVWIPDVSPSDHIRPDTDFSMCAGEFVEVYGCTSVNDKSLVGPPSAQGGGGEPEENPCCKPFDAVLTSYFLDTARNVLLYIRTIAKILSPGGLWANIGPLLYHYAEMPNEMSIELAWDELQDAIKIWFDIEKVEWHDAYYTSNPQSMMQVQYHCVYFVAIRNTTPSPDVRPLPDSF